MKESTRLKLEALEAEQRSEKARRRARWAPLRWLALVVAVAVGFAVLWGLIALGDTETRNAWTAAILLLGAVALYFVPTVFAHSRKHPARGGIFVVNLLLGWTLLGWIVALAWAAARPKPPSQ